MATFNNQSPSVTIVEQDFSAIVEPTNVSIVASVGPFTWGPADDVKIITTRSQLERVFGKPSEDNYKGFFSVFSLLGYTNHVKVARVVSLTAYNATSGGNGTGLTLTANILNGKVSSISIQNGGSGYIVGDMFQINGGVIENAIGRVTDIGNGGEVTAVELKTNGSGYSAAASFTTSPLNAVQVKNKADFDRAGVLPDIIAKYPSALGNSLGVGVVRASEFDNWKFKRRFIRPPAADVWKLAANGKQNTFTLPDAFPADGVVSVSGERLEQGTTPGHYSVSGTTLTIHTETQSFTADGNTYRWAFAPTIPVRSYVVRVNGSEIPVNADLEVELPAGQARVVNNELVVGTNLKRFSGDGATGVFTIVGVTGITDAHVWVDGVEKTVVSNAPANVNEVQVADDGAGNTRVVFYAGAEPAAGIDNVEVRWGYLANGSTVEVEYGFPEAGEDTVKVFFNQTDVHVVVFDTEGAWSGEKDYILEVFGDLSLDKTAKDESGLSNFYRNVVNRRSEYVYIVNDLIEFGNYELSHGTDGLSDLDDGDLMKGWDIFLDKDRFTITHLVPGDVSLKVKKYVLEQIAEKRKDCIAWIAPEMEDVVYNAFNEVKAVLTTREAIGSSSWGAMVDNWKKMYDTYNDREIWVPCDADGAGIYARTSNDFYPWLPGAGLNRGRLKDVIELAWNPNKAARDELYARNVNSIFFAPSDGFVLWGNKTLQAKASAFDRINVRLMFILIEQAIAKAAKYFIMELNTPVTRELIRNMIASFLRTVKALDGIEDYRVVCDERNNPEEVRARHELIVDVLVKPVYSIEFITLRFSAVGPNVSFDYLINEKIAVQ